MKTYIASLIGVASLSGFVQYVAVRPTPLPEIPLDQTSVIETIPVPSYEQISIPILDIEPALSLAPIVAPDPILEEVIPLPVVEETFIYTDDEQDEEYESSDDENNYYESEEDD